MNRIKLFECVLFSNIVFWLVSNFWCYIVWYERGLESFIMCYVLAIPFFFTAFLKTFAVSYIVNEIILRIKYEPKYERSS